MRFTHLNLHKILATSEQLLEPLPFDPDLEELIEAGHHEAVITYILERIDEGEHDNRLYLYQLVHSYWALGQTEEAHDVCDYVAAQHPNEPYFWEHHLLLAMRDAQSENPDKLVSAVYHARQAAALHQRVPGHPPLEKVHIGETPLHHWINSLEKELIIHIIDILDSVTETELGSTFDKWYPILEEERNIAVEREELGTAITIWSKLIEIMKQKMRFPNLRKVVEALVELYVSVSDVESARGLLHDPDIRAKLGNHAAKIENKIAKGTAQKGPDQDIPVSELDRARQFLAAGDTTAIRHYDRAILASPVDFEIAIEKGRALIDLHNYAGAVSYLTRLKRKPGLTEMQEDEIAAYLTLAKLINEGPESARQVIGPALEHRQTPLLLIALAECQLHSHQFQEAKESLDVMAALHEAAPPLLREKTTGLLRHLFHSVYPVRSKLTDGEVAALIDFCRHAAARGCTGPDIRMNEAIATSFLGPEKLSDAIAMAQSVITDFPHDYRGYWALGEIYETAEDLEHAEEYLMRADAVKGNFQSMRHHYLVFLSKFSRELFHRGHFSRTIEIYNRLLTLGEEANPKVHSGLVMSYYFNGQYAETIRAAEGGIKVCRPASAAKPNEHFVDRFLMTFYSALAYYQLGDPRAAHRLFDKYSQNTASPPEKVPVSGGLASIHTLIQVTAQAKKAPPQKLWDEVRDRLETTKPILDQADRNLFLERDIVAGSHILASLWPDLNSLGDAPPQVIIEKLKELTQVLLAISTRWNIPEASTAYQGVLLYF